MFSISAYRVVASLHLIHNSRCTSGFDRRRPFIATGSLAITIFLIGYAADLGHMFGDSLAKNLPCAISIFVAGFWILDVTNNMLQGPCHGR